MRIEAIDFAGCSTAEVYQSYMPGTDVCGHRKPPTIGSVGRLRRTFGEQSMHYALRKGMQLSTL